MNALLTGVGIFITGALVVAIGTGFQAIFKKLGMK